MPSRFDYGRFIRHPRIFPHQTGAEVRLGRHFRPIHPLGNRRNFQGDPEDPSVVRRSSVFGLYFLLCSAPELQPIRKLFPNHTGRAPEN